MKNHVQPFDMVNTTMYEYQEDVLSIAETHYEKFKCAFFNVFCSFGKTVVAAYRSHVFSQLGLLTLVLAPRTMIRKSWVGTFKNHTNAKVYVVGVTKGEIPDDVQVIVSLDQSVSKIPKEILKKVGHLVLDEAHMYCTDSKIRSLLATEPEYITCLTATYKRDDGFHTMLDLLVGPNKITRISSKEFKVFRFGTKMTPKNYTVTERGVMWSSVAKQIDIIPGRDELIMKILNRYKNKHKIMIVTRHIEHVNVLGEKIQGTLNITPAKIAGNVQSYDDSSIIVGTISKIGVGFDEKESCSNWDGCRIDMLILASSVRKPEQIVGRAFRANLPIIIDMVDSFPNCYKHWAERKEWYISRNADIGNLTAKSLEY